MLHSNPRSKRTLALGGIGLALVGAALLSAPGSAAAQAGSYQGSCRNSTNAGGRLFSECRTPDGQYRRSSIEAGKCQGDIGNQNGILVCHGATAQDGGLVANPPAGRNDGNNGRGRDDRGGRGDDRNFGDRGHDDRGGHGRRQADLVLFEGANYTGRSFEVHGDISDMKHSGFNDRAHSVKVYSGKWKLCRESDYRRCEHVKKDVPDLSHLGAGGSISSIERE